jgi:hypothetical protein
MEIACLEATRGYGLDLSGDHFDEGSGEFEGFLVYEHPWISTMVDNFPWIAEHSWDGPGTPVYVFKPDELMCEEPAWPAEIIRDDIIWKFAHYGTVNETDRDCICHGKETNGEWEFTGNYLDGPYPKCDRCDGHGTVVSPGGYWALYFLCDRENLLRNTALELEGRETAPQ